MTEEINMRKMEIRLLLGNLGKTWTIEEVYQQTINKLKNISDFVNLQNAMFVRDLLLEILRQTPPTTYDFRGLPEFYISKMKDKGREREVRYIEECRLHWTALCRQKVFEVEFPFATVQPYAYGAEDPDEWAHLVQEDRIDMITSIPKSDQQILANWKKNLIDAGSTLADSHISGPKDEFILMSLKNVKWRFGLYHKETCEKPGTSLAKYLLENITAMAKKHGGITEVVTLPEASLHIYGGVLPKSELMPGYKVRLKKEFRKQLLKEVQESE